jgi:hypothetical protein
MFLVGMGWERFRFKLPAQVADKLGESFAGTKNPDNKVVASNHPAASCLFWRPLLLI